MGEAINEVIDVQVTFTRGKARPVRFVWHNREVRLKPPAKVDRFLSSQIWDYWCMAEDAANLYQLRWDVKLVEWRLMEISEIQD